MKRLVMRGLILTAMLCASAAFAMMCEGIQEEAHQVYLAGDYDKAVRKSVEAMESDQNYRVPIPFLERSVAQSV